MACICAHSSGQLDGLGCVYCDGTGDQRHFPADRVGGMPDCANPGCGHPFKNHGIGSQKDKIFCHVLGCHCPAYQRA